MKKIGGKKHQRSPQSAVQCPVMGGGRGESGAGGGVDDEESSGSLACGSCVPLKHFIFVSVFARVFVFVFVFVCVIVITRRGERLSCLRLLCAGSLALLCRLSLQFAGSSAAVWSVGPEMA